MFRYHLLLNNSWQVLNIKYLCKINFSLLAFSPHVIATKITKIFHVSLINIFSFLHLLADMEEILQGMFDVEMDLDGRCCLLSIIISEMHSQSC